MDGRTNEHTEGQTRKGRIQKWQRMIAKGRHRIQFSRVICYLNTCVKQITAKVERNFPPPMVQSLIKKRKKNEREKIKKEKRKKRDAKTSVRGTNVDTDLLYAGCLQDLYEMPAKKKNF